MLNKEKESDKRCRILKTSLQLFSHFGFSKTTVNDIADQLSLSSTMIYHYYPDKNSVFEAVLKDLMLNYQTEVKEAFDAAETAEEALYQQLDIKNKTLMQHYKLFFGVLSNSSKDDFMPIKTAVEETENGLFAAAIEKGAQSGEFELKMSVRQHADLMQQVMRNLFMTICPQPLVGVIKESDLEHLMTLQKQVLSQFILALKFKTDDHHQNYYLTTDHIAVK